ncbi:hypothetical protein Fmac_003566 [Flemingia macrophylla]|uniref:Cell wall hydroxyproline-rich glycoprotein n=1 Tax=Flemingia macrophylla TaxID=520843 RepID=A0ABD1NN84_9FABA
MSEERKMDSKYMCALVLVVNALLLGSFSSDVGGGGDGYGYGYSPPPPAACPPPPPRLTRLQKAGKAIRKFSRDIVDENGYTKNWKGDDVCKYRGVRCDTYPEKKERAVAGIDLNGAKISGRNGTLDLSNILGTIPELTFFHVNSNSFGGSIPADISKYKYFFELDLSNNQVEGEFPKEVLESTQLVFLDLRYNRLSGPIPAQLFQLNLDVIFINNNEFSGNLPDNFGSTPARFLTFANNQLTGPIPSSIGQASKTLTEVLFLGNRFEGCLPYQIGYLKKASVFDVSRNWLTGPIPHSFGCLESIRYLNLERNQFYGEVPEMVCQLPGLSNNGNLSLSYNYFTQVGPACRTLIKKNVLDVSYNCILGLPNQRPHGECSQFFSDVKPCPYPKYLHYVPCKGYYPQIHTASAPSPPITYNSLIPHR